MIQMFMSVTVFAAVAMALSTMIMRVTVSASAMIMGVTVRYSGLVRMCVAGFARG